MTDLPKKRRILHKLDIEEISGVDRPCQEGARVSIMKRDPRTLEDRINVLKEDIAAIQQDFQQLNLRKEKPVPTITAKDVEDEVKDDVRSQQIARFNEAIHKDGRPTTAAMTAARRADPSAYVDFQKAETNTAFDALVKAEIAASGGYMTREIAALRVSTKYGPNPPADMVEQLRKAAADGDAAMELLRKRHPSMAARMGAR